jgi:hypothetical protein
MTKRRFLTFTFICVALAAAMAGSLASDWTPFSYVSNGVSVSFARVANDTYTWKFHNGSSERIRYMKFSYSYIDAATGRYKTDTDVIPSPLRPGETFGGWAAYTANTRSQPTIRIVEVETR